MIVVTDRTHTKETGWPRSESGYGGIRYRELSKDQASSAGWWSDQIQHAVLTVHAKRGNVLVALLSLEGLGKVPTVPKLQGNND